MKIAIYTVLTGNYDEIRIPLVIDKRFDYILFSDKMTRETIGPWRVQSIPNVIDDVQRLSRFPKMQPHVVLPDYDYSLYIDANVQIATQFVYDRVIELINSSIALAGIKHQTRNCAYEESFRVLVSLPNINKRHLLHEMSKFKQQGFPFNYGMYEANVIFRSHSDEKVRAQCDEWWSIYKTAVKRDQLCYSYTLWKHQMQWCFFLPEEFDTKSHDSFIYHEHVGGRKIVMENKRKYLRNLYRPLFCAYKILITSLSYFI